MRLQDWLGFGSLAAGLAAVAGIVRSDWAWVWTALVASVVLGIATRVVSVRYPSPIPYALRWTLRAPRGKQSAAHVRGLLEPRPGERVLEIGPGPGLHAVPVAASLVPGGRLEVLDVQLAMLRDVLKRAADREVVGIAATQGDACSLPYGDASFDAACLIGVLGEIPDGDAALRELRRVLKPGGRVVVGEVFFDPDFVRLGELERRMGLASFALDRKQGGSLSFLARFVAT
ncbi:MAG: methyltransferase domain-containing protein [Thermoanaerobaculia bacterium]|nr:methyltransferase domain-containing protein [Thermoanaerobaculia bacterium]